MNNLTNEELIYIQQVIDYEFEEIRLLRQAFTRKSYSEEGNGAYNNEVLEFYGDKALEIVVMKNLSEHFGSRSNNGKYVSNKTEGQLTELKKKLICKKTLAERIDFLELQDYLLLGNGDIGLEIQNQASVKEDLFEAIIGAVAIDSNWDMDELENVVEKMLGLENLINNAEESINYIDEIQIWCRKRDFVPSFEYQISEDGYECILEISESIKYFREIAYSKKEARMLACKAAYEYLAKTNQLITVYDEVGYPEFDTAINQLQELYQKGYIEKPYYYFEERYDHNGNPIWFCRCEADGYYAYGEYSSKKHGKKDVSYEVLRSLMESLFTSSDFYNEQNNDHNDDYFDDDDDEYYH
ncbi:MAG: hypothetical protein IJY41_02250 [Clostridia bacterium]|nr:hypothetical protein [Clostridia bacterium]